MPCDPILRSYRIGGGYEEWRDIDPYKFLTRHSGARGEARKPESISDAGGYRFRLSPPSRLGRNDDLKGWA
jgi:hypothetical protein